MRVCKRKLTVMKRLSVRKQRKSLYEKRKRTKIAKVFVE